MGLLLTKPAEVPLFSTGADRIESLSAREGKDMKNKTSPPVRHALLARCIAELSEGKEGDRNLQKIHGDAQLLFDSLFGTLTFSQRDEYYKFIERARKKEFEALLAESSSANGPN